MADFCKACSIEYFNRDFNDLAGLVNTGAKYALVICRGCGVIQVDHEGLCQSPDCLLKGKPGHGGTPAPPPTRAAPERDEPKPDKPSKIHWG